MFDCTELQEMRKRLVGFAGAFDAELLDGDAAGKVVKAVATMTNTLSSIKVRAALRLEQTQTFRRDGHPSAAHQLAHATGSSVGKAKSELEAAKRLEALPATAKALSEGTLSADKAAAVADAASADPSAEGRLLDHAQRRSLGELKDECARVKAAADPDPDATRRRVHAERGARTFGTGVGSSRLVWDDTTERIAEAWAVVTGYANTEFDLARLEERHESEAAYAADGMLARPRAATGGASPPVKVEGKRVRRPVPANVIFRCDAAAAKRGWVEPGEVCDLVGHGPVPVSAIRDLVEHQDPFIAAVVTKGVDVMSVAHLRRNPTAYQLTALLWQQPECTRLGCNRTARLENDHRDDWAKTHRTPTDGIDPLCHHDHALKTRYEWALVEGKGKRAMVPKDHPDHPKNKHKKRPPP